MGMTGGLAADCRRCSRPDCSAPWKGLAEEAADASAKLELYTQLELRAACNVTEIRLQKRA